MGMCPLPGWRESQRYVYLRAMKNAEYGIWYMGKFLPLWGGLYLGTSEAFFRGALRDVSRTLKCDDNAAVVVWYED